MKKISQQCTALALCFFLMQGHAIVHTTSRTPTSALASHTRLISYSTLSADSALSSPASAWKVKLTSKSEGINLTLDLYEESILVPDMDFLGEMHGYMSGNIYGVWMITSKEIIDSTRARIRLSNDLGSDTQEILLTHPNDSLYHAELIDGVCIKKVVNKKLVKIPAVLDFVKR